MMDMMPIFVLNIQPTVSNWWREFLRTLDEGDELAFLRVRSKKHEIMIAPDKDYILVVIQNPQEI